MPPHPKTGTHIAEIDYREMFRVAFGDNPDEAAKFLDAVKAKAKVDPDANRAKLLLYRAARMIWLADQMDREDIAYARPAVQVLFFVITAEAVAKLHADFHEAGKSAQFVKRFFASLCTDDHRKRLASAFSTGRTGGFYSWERVVDLLYDIRCRMAHEGAYSDLMLPEALGEVLLSVDWKAALRQATPPKQAAKKGKKPPYVPAKTVYARITADELRQIILEGTVEAARSLAGV